MISIPKWGRDRERIITVPFIKLFSTQKKNKQIKQTRQTWKYLHMGNLYKPNSFCTYTWSNNDHLFTNEIPAWLHSPIEKLVNSLNNNCIYVRCHHLAKRTTMNKLQEEYQVPKKKCRYDECEDSSFQLSITEACLESMSKTVRGYHLIFPYYIQLQKP